MNKALIGLIQTARRKRLLNNCYSANFINDADDFWTKDENLLFSYQDHGVSRLIFFIDRIESLTELVGEVQGTHYIEFITKEPKTNLSRGELIAQMKRLANVDCRNVFEADSPVIQYRNDKVGALAKEQDALEINQILWSAFRPEISHLLTNEEIIEKIKERQITIHKARGKIDAILQAEVFPRKFYINQIINKTNREIIHGILLSRLEEYVLNGGKYVYAWVEDQNVASVKFHKKYNMTHDGTWSLIYRVG